MKFKKKTLRKRGYLSRILANRGVIHVCFLLYDEFTSIVQFFILVLSAPQFMLISGNSSLWSCLFWKRITLPNAWWLDDTHVGCLMLRHTEQRVGSVGISLLPPLQALFLPGCHSLSTSLSLTCTMRRTWVALVPGSSTALKEFCKAWWEPCPPHSSCPSYWSWPT